MLYDNLGVLKYERPLNPSPRKKQNKPMYSSTSCIFLPATLAKTEQQGKPVQARRISKDWLLHEKRMSMSRKAADSLPGDVETIQQASTKSLTSYYKTKWNEKKNNLAKRASNVCNPARIIMPKCDSVWSSKKKGNVAKLTIRISLPFSCLVWDVACMKFELFQFSLHSNRDFTRVTFIYLRRNGINT